MAVRKKTRGAQSYTTVLANIDLESSVFEDVAEEFKSFSTESDSYIILEDGAKVTVPDGASLQLCLFLRRRVFFDVNAIESSCDKIDEICKSILSADKGNSLSVISFIDCGERPSAPLSDLTYLGVHLENVCQRFHANVVGKVFAADFDYSHSQGSTGLSDVEIFDTKDPNFHQRVSEYVSISIMALNENFGQGSILQLGKRSPGVRYH